MERIYNTTASDLVGREGQYIEIEDGLWGELLSAWVDTDGTDGGDPGDIVTSFARDSRAYAPDRPIRFMANPHKLPDGSGAICTDEGAVWMPWTDGHAIGFRVLRPDGRMDHLYLNPSDSTGEDAAVAFVYTGPYGDPDSDEVTAHYSYVWEGSDR